MILILIAVLTVHLPISRLRQILYQPTLLQFPELPSLHFQPILLSRHHLLPLNQLLLAQAVRRTGRIGMVMAASGMKLMTRQGVHYTVTSLKM